MISMWSANCTLLLGKHSIQKVQSSQKRQCTTLSHNERKCLVSVFTFLCSIRGFKELDSQVLYGEYGGVSFLLPVLVLFPQALHTARTQALRLQWDLTGSSRSLEQVKPTCISRGKRVQWIKDLSTSVLCNTSKLQQMVVIVSRDQRQVCACLCLQWH